MGAEAGRTIEKANPALFLALGIFALAFVVLYFVSIPEPHMETASERQVKHKHSPLSFRHFVFGAIAIFIYVGIEIGIPGTLNFYLADSSDKGAGIMMNGAAIGGAIAAIYWLLMLVGRTASSAISGKVSSRAQLIAVSATAIIFVLIAIFTPKDVTVSMPGYTVGEGFMMAQAQYYRNEQIKPMIDEKYGEGASDFFAQAIENYYKVK